MAHTLTDGAVWTGQDVKVAQVLAAIDDLRRGAERLATRTSVVTLVVVARRDEEADSAIRAVHWLGGRHPARVVVIHADAQAPARLDARVAVDDSNGGRLWSEDVILRVGGDAALHLPSLVEPFTLPDLPVVVWYVASVPTPGDELASACSALIIDSKALAGAAAGRILEIARVRPVIDLSWVRLQPWRELLAGLFDGSAYRPFVRGARSVTVEGKAGPRHLLAGWLATRLAIPRAEVHLTAADAAAMRLVAEHDGRTGRFEVFRHPGEEVLSARADVEGGPNHEEIFPLPDSSTSVALVRSLSRIDRDPIYERALAATLGFDA